jgi:hypothetical protein
MSGLKALPVHFCRRPSALRTYDAGAPQTSLTRPASDPRPSPPPLPHQLLPAPPPIPPAPSPQPPPVLRQTRLVVSAASALGPVSKISRCPSCIHSAWCMLYSRVASTVLVMLATAVLICGLALRTVGHYCCLEMLDCKDDACNYPSAPGSSHRYLSTYKNMYLPYLSLQHNYSDAIARKSVRRIV